VFFILALLATLGYALQGVLMAGYYRSMDRLSAVTYRGLSLGISMLPLLLFVPAGTFGQWPALLPLILSAAVLAALGNWCNATVISHLPVGIANALCMGAVSLTVTSLGYLVLDERLLPRQLLFVALILMGVLLLGLSRSRPLVAGALPPARLGVGLLFSGLFGLLLGSAFMLVAQASREAHPFLVAYSWEFGIGLCALLMTGLRRALGGAALQALPLRQFARLLLCASPTAIGTGLYALAMTLGPVAIAAAVVSSMMVFSTLFGYLLYGERPSRRQGALILFICVAVVGLKLAG